MAYDVSDHPLLGSKGTQLFAKSSEAFEQQQAWAVDLLRLEADTSYTAAERLSINRALALQINWQLELPLSLWYMKQEASAQSKSSITYRDGVSLISPMAQGALPATVTARQWGSITSVRRAVR